MQLYHRFNQKVDLFSDTFVFEADLFKKSAKTQLEKARLKRQKYKKILLKMLRVADCNDPEFIGRTLRNAINELDVITYSLASGLVPTSPPLYLDHKGDFQLASSRPCGITSHELAKQAYMKPKRVFATKLPKTIEIIGPSTVTPTVSRQDDRDHLKQEAGSTIECVHKKTSTFSPPFSTENDCSLSNLTTVVTSETAGLGESVDGGMNVSCDVAAQFWDTKIVHQEIYEDNPVIENETALVQLHEETYTATPELSDVKKVYNADDSLRDPNRIKRSDIIFKPSPYGVHFASIDSVLGPFKVQLSAIPEENEVEVREVEVETESEPESIEEPMELTAGSSSDIIVAPITPLFVSSDFSSHKSDFKSNFESKSEVIDTSELDELISQIDSIVVGTNGSISEIDEPKGPQVIDCDELESFFNLLEFVQEAGADKRAKVLKGNAEVTTMGITPVSLRSSMYLVTQQELDAEAQTQRFERHQEEYFARRQRKIEKFQQSSPGTFFNKEFKAYLGQVYTRLIVKRGFKNTSILMKHMENEIAATPWLDREMTLPEYDHLCNTIKLCIDQVIGGQDPQVIRDDAQSLLFRSPLISIYQKYIEFQEFEQWLLFQIEESKLLQC